MRAGDVSITADLEWAEDSVRLYLTDSRDCTALNDSRASFLPLFGTGVCCDGSIGIPLAAPPKCFDI